MNIKEKYGTWALVTGASDGMGKAVAQQLAIRGLNLVLVARSQNKLESFKAELQNTHPIQIKTLALDLSERSANPILFDATRDLDIGLFVAAAGFGSAGNFVDNNCAIELNMIDLNCRSVVEQTHEFATRFKNRQRGSLVLFSSIFAFQGVPRSANYAATKAFIQTFGEGLSLELAPLGVDVLLVAPGPVLSGFAHRAQMNISFGATPDQVGVSIVKTLGKRTTLRPGWLAKVLEFALWSTFSRRIRTRLLAVITKDMTRQ